MSLEPTLEPHLLEEGRTKLSQVFKYLKALHEQRYPPARSLSQHPFTLPLSDVPDHPCIEAFGEAFVLRVQRPAITPCPPLPESLKAWVPKGWDQPNAEPQPREQLDGETADEDAEFFDDDEERVETWDGWLSEWRDWAPSAKIERQVERIYQRVYEQHSVLEREGERYELLVGDGVVAWSLPEGPVVHPILLKPLELLFDAKLAEFRLVENQRPTEVYTAPLRSTEVDARILSRVREQVEGSQDIHPVEQEATNDFLQGFAASLDPNGRFVSAPVQTPSSSPVVFRSPVIIRRLKVAGLGAAIDQVLEDLITDPTEEGTLPTWFVSPPEGLMRVVGVETRAGDGAGDGSSPAPRDPEEDEGTYFTKPANLEQHRIVRKLEEAGCVLVQGPPGTGKTHTIGNLVGHLLAQGKSVLVTSHTTKALSVVREQVVEPLRPLCVSVLESDRENRDRLEASVQRIAERLTEDGGALPRTAEGLKGVRTELIGKVTSLKARLRSARGSEFEPISYFGESIRPIDAAKIVAEGLGTHDWIPGSVVDGAPVPLTPEEFLALYESNHSLSTDDEANHPEDFPNVSALLGGEAFTRLVSDTNGYRAMRLDLDTSLFVGAPSESLPQIGPAITLVREATDALLGDGAQWKRMLIESAQRGLSNQWERLVESVESLLKRAAEANHRILRVGPEWPTGTDVREAVQVCLEIEAFLGTGKRLTGVALMLHRPWKRVVETLKVADGAPATTEHFAVAREALELLKDRAELIRVWNGMMDEVGGPKIEGSLPRPEQFAQPLLVDIRDCLEWQRKRWPSVDRAVSACGIGLKQAVLKVPNSSTPSAEIDRLTNALSRVVLPALERMQARIEKGQLEHRLATYKATIGAIARDHAGIPLIQRLAQCVSEEDAKGYSDTLLALSEVVGKASAITLRRELLRKLAAIAPEWSQAIRLREGIHGARAVPDGIQHAWKWKQLEQELVRRSNESVQDLMAQLTDARKECERTTARLVETLAWHNQFRRVTLPMRQSLMGYVETLRRIGRGTGRRVPRLLIEAQRQMGESQGAVPVWVMPLSRVVESFDLRKARFDVVIVDEASQLDLTGLVALYMARQVVIVGDHEQVEPLAVGQRLDEVQSLIDEMLEGIPNAHLWDGRQSVYSLAKSAFEPIALREHFRCVPQIISFSNRLSYRGEILPLREDSEVETRPFVVPYYIQGAVQDRRTNRHEAETLVALMKASLEQPEYDGKTFGAINLVGDDDSDQARLVYSLASKHIGEVELSNRRFRCGNSAQFQGDERHVMFLSMLDVPQGGPMSMRNDDLFKKRYNVAASRAKDQMWVIYSLNPETDLKRGDLRKELIDFALCPDALDRVYDTMVAQTESDFEERVLRQLIDGGYRNVQPQYRVGAYRIDFVVTDGKRKLAIECDGDRYHGADQLDSDMARQSTLERLGWRFVRIRGSEFYRDPKGTMDRVFKKLSELGVPPDYAEVDTDVVSVESDLLDRVKARASQLLREWRGEVVVDDLTDMDERDDEMVPIFSDTDVQADTTAPKDKVYVQFDDLPVVEAPDLNTTAHEEELVETTQIETRPLDDDDLSEMAKAIIYSVLSRYDSVPREQLLRECAPLLTGHQLDRRTRRILNRALYGEYYDGRISISIDGKEVRLDGS